MANTIAIELGASAIERFWSHVDQAGDCWTWKSGLDQGGYGAFASMRVKYRAHRVSYTLAYGPIPGDRVIDHKCRNRACVNPGHLEAVTNHENILRGIEAGFGPGRPQSGHLQVRAPVHAG